MNHLASFFILLICATSSVFGNLISKKDLYRYGAGHSVCTYIGKLEEMRKYHQNATQGQIDDGIFVAVPDRKSPDKYNYYELGFTLTGAKDGGPAYLPENPALFVSITPPYIYSKTAHNHPDKPGYFTTWGRNKDRKIPLLPDGAILPKGTLFFHWISGGGDYNLNFSILEPIKHITITVDATITPSPEESLWFDSSETVSASFKVFEMSEDEYFKKFSTL